MSKVQDNSPCPICGKTSYSWGHLHAQNLKFVSDDEGFLEKHFRSGIQKSSARQCNRCGNIQLFSQDFVGEK